MQIYFHTQFLWSTSIKIIDDYHLAQHRIDGEMVYVFASSVVDREFEPRSSQTKDYNIGICCFSTKHAALRRKNKDWLESE